MSWPTAATAQLSKQFYRQSSAHGDATRAAQAVVVYASSVAGTLAMVHLLMCMFCSLRYG